MNDLLSSAQAVELAGLSRAGEIHSAAKRRGIKPIVHKAGKATVMYWRRADVLRIARELKPREPKERMPGCITIPELARKLKLSRQRVHQRVDALVESGEMERPTLWKNLRWVSVEQQRLIGK